MSIVKFPKDVMFLKKKWHMAIRKPHKHVTCLLKIVYICTEVRTDVTLLSEVRLMSILRVCEAVRLLVQLGIFLY